MKWNCVILIPAYNPPEDLLAHLTELRQHGFADFILVDDGSSAARKNVFEQAERMGCVVIKNPEKQGKGYALKAGFAYYIEHDQGKFDGVITLSANVRFPVQSVEKIAEALREERTKGTHALVLGSRNFFAPGLPRASRFGSKVSQFICNVLLGIHLKDCMTGLRGIPDDQVQLCLEIPGHGYEYETSMVLRFESIGYREVETRTLPAPQGAERAYRRGKDTFYIVLTMMKRFLMFTAVSVSVSIFDIFLFWIFTEYVFTDVPFCIIWSTILARIISATVNYIVNRQVVFQTNEDRIKSAAQFLVLSIAQCLTSALLVYLLEKISSGNAVGLKVLVDVMLFFVNYKVQKKFIFVEEAQRT